MSTITLQPGTRIIVVRRLRKGTRATEPATIKRVILGLPQGVLVVYDRPVVVSLRGSIPEHDTWQWVSADSLEPDRTPERKATP